MASIEEKSTEDIQPSINTVILRDVSKSYGYHKKSCDVLQNVNLTVPKGTIYGLLGPSGCGKTTILRTIVGTLTVNQGTILVFGQSPENKAQKSKKTNVGYMPQDISLNEKLTVKETFHFYGAICGVDKAHIDSKCEFLMELLGIVYPNKIIETLSGGQKRRVSFAVALLHEPELLILDEPTVGVDPILRKKIWDYLYSLENTTIILTTHYIEEARMAHNVGLMLNGKILAEAPPNTLMEQHNCSTLEKVFLKLCMQIGNPNDAFGNHSQGKHGETTTGNSFEMNPLREHCTESKTTPDYESETDTETSFSFSDTYHAVKNYLKGFLPKKSVVEVPKWFRIEALILKNVLFFGRHKGAMAFEVLLPPIVMIIASVTIGTPLFGILVGVVNYDSQPISKLFLGSINDSIIQVPYSTYEEAEKAVLQGSIKAIVHFNHNFSETTKTRFQLGALSDDYTLNESCIGIYLDMSNPQIAFTINNELIFAFQRFSQQLLGLLDLNPNSGNLPLKYESRQVYGTEEIVFNQFLFPGFLVCVGFFLAMALTSVGLIIEKQNGSYERTLIAGVQPTELIIGHVVSQFLLLGAQVLTMIIVTFALLGYTCQGSLGLVIVLSFMQGMCGMGLGLAISSLFKEEVLIVLVSIAIWCFFLFSQGYLWPVQAMPYLLQLGSRFLPQTYSVEAMRSIVNRGWGITHSEILISFGITIVWTIIFLVSACLLSNRRGL